MKKIVLLALLTAASSFALACSGDDNKGDGGPDGSVTDAPADVQKTDSGGNDGGNDGGITPPAIKGTQVDRMGRPTINTALNHVFDTNASAKGTAKDTYNADKNIGGWATAYAPEFAKNLAIFDSLDTVCGNQLGYANGSYAGLAGLTADDRLYVNTAGAQCTTYLAVEANALNIIPNSDCGGRKLAYDVVDVTYSAVSVGAVSGVTDGIGPVAAKTNGTTFPYLAAPQ